MLTPINSTQTNNPFPPINITPGNSINTDEKKTKGINPYRILFELHNNQEIYKPQEINKNKIKMEYQKKLYEIALSALGCERIEKCNDPHLPIIVGKTTFDYPTENAFIGKIIQDQKKYYVIQGNRSVVVESDPERGIKYAKQTDNIINDFLKRSSKPFPNKIYIVSEELNIKKANLLEIGGAKYDHNEDLKGKFPSIRGEYIDKDGKRLRSLDSEDTLAHETGHAILDHINPNVTKDVHEAFADSVAFLTQASKKESIQKVINQKIDLKKTNFLSTQSENSEYHKELDRILEPGKKPREYIRDLSQIHKYNPNEIEEHQKSLALSSTIYQSWVEYIDYLQSKGLSKEQAIIKANETFKDLIVKTAETDQKLDTPTFTQRMIEIAQDPKLKEILTLKAKEREIPLR